MKIEIEFDLDNLVNECIHQSLLDTQLFQSKEGVPMTDAVALSSSNNDVVLTELGSQLAQLYTAFADKVEYSYTDELFITIDCHERTISNSFRETIASHLKDYLKYGILAWWNEARNKELHFQYKMKQEDVRSFITNIVFPKIRRTYNYY